LEKLMSFDHRKSMAVLLVLAALFFSSCGKKEVIDWDSFRSPDKLFKIDYPPTWKHALDGHVFNINPPDSVGLVTVSGYVDPGTTFDEKKFKDMVMLDFVECRVRESFKKVVGTNWVGEDAVYERIVNDQKWIYLFRVAHRGQVGAFVAVCDLDTHIKTRIHEYKEIMDSLIILDNPTKPLDLSRVKEGEKENKPKPWQENLIDWIRSTEKKEDRTSYYGY